MLRQELAAVALVLLLTAGLHAQTASTSAAGWRGVKVLPKLTAVVKVENGTVDCWKFRCPWIVQGVNGQWLCVGDNRKGWVQRSDVATLEEAPQYYTALIDRGQALAWAYRGRAIAWVEQGKLDLAIADYGAALRLAPSATCYNGRGWAWKRKKKYDNAISDFNQAIRLAPTFARAYDNRGAAWVGKREYDKAIADYNHAISLDPNFAMPYNDRGDVWNGKQQYDRAIADFNQAVRLNPNLSFAYNSIAWLKSTCPEARYRNGASAVAMATKACELTGWTDASNVGTLGAAYAEAGDFEPAIQWQQRAIELNGNDADFVRGGNERLQLYRQHKPYRE